MFSNKVPELFARVVPQRMQIFSLGDDLEGHFQRFGFIFRAGIRAKSLQNASRTLPNEVQTALGVHLEVENASKPRFASQTPPVLELNLLKNRSKRRQPSRATL